MNISRSSAQGTHISEINFNNIWGFFSSASDDINTRQTRWPKWEVDENRVKKSAQAKLTFLLLLLIILLLFVVWFMALLENENKSSEGICSIFHTQTHFDFVEAYISLIETWEST